MAGQDTSFEQDFTVEVRTSVRAVDRNDAIRKADDQVREGDYRVTAVFDEDGEAIS